MAVLSRNIAPHKFRIWLQNSMYASLDLKLQAHGLEECQAVRSFNICRAQCIPFVKGIRRWPTAECVMLLQTAMGAILGHLANTDELG